MSKKKKKNQKKIPKNNKKKDSYLKLRSGDAHRTATLGICGTKRIAIAT